MKRFFKNKESGAITPLPPNQPPTPSSFEVPREFDQYQRQQHRLSSPTQPRYADDPRNGGSQGGQYGALPPSLRPGQVVPRHDLHHSIEPPQERSNASRSQRARSDHSRTDTSSHSDHDYSSDEAALYPTSHAERRSSMIQTSSARRRSSQAGHHAYAARDISNPVANASHYTTTAYPVYSDQGEVMVSQGHYEDDANADSKDRKKKLFGFTSSTRDKRSKTDREPASDPPSAPWSHEGQPHQHETYHVRERPKEGWMDKWNKRAQQQQDHRIQDRELEGLVASKIGWIAANANSEEEWMEILPLIDMVSHSEAASKEAVKVLRREFKYGSVDSQRRAVRIWALLTLNSSDRFRFQVATKRFLDTVEDTISSSKTPLSVKDTMLRVLGVLAFEFKDDSELLLITKCWNKAKPSDRPKNGEPLENDLFEFRLPQPPRFAAPLLQQQHQSRDSRSLSHDAQFSQQGQHHNMHVPPDPGLPLGGYETHYAPNTTQSHQQLHHEYQQSQLSVPANQRHRHANSDSALVASEPRRDSHDPNAHPTTWSEPFNQLPGVKDNVPQHYDVVSKFEAMVAPDVDNASAFLPKSNVDLTAADLVIEEERRRLHEQCQTGKSHANVLIDMMIHEDSDNNSSELVDEFYSKVMQSQVLVVSQIPWASAQADQSREKMNQQRAIAASAHKQMADGETEEEQLLAELLETHSRLTEASSLVDEMRRRVAEEEEERRVTERSKVEVRLDRSALALDPVTGNLYDVHPQGRTAHHDLLDPYSTQQQASGSRSASPSAAVSPRSSVLSPSSAASGVGSTASHNRVSRPLPVPRSDASLDSNGAASGDKYQQHSSLQAAAGSAYSRSRLSLNQSTGSGGSDSRTHSRDTSQSSQFAPSLTHRVPMSSESSNGTNHAAATSTHNRSLPLTPPALTTSGLLQQRTQIDDEDEMKTPILPSEKALGKRRAVSVRLSSPPAPNPDPAAAFSRLDLTPK